MVKDGALNLDFEEEVTKATVITHGGAVVSEAVAEAARSGRRQRVTPSSTAFLSNFTIFMLAILCGFAVISKVPATLHTPLMSGANSIHGIVLVGAMFIAIAADRPDLVPAVVRRGRVRDAQRRRRLRRHRPDAPDVQAQARGTQGREGGGLAVDLTWLSTRSSTSPGSQVPSGSSWA